MGSIHKFLVSLRRRAPSAPRRGSAGAKHPLRLMIDSSRHHFVNASSGLDGGESISRAAPEVEPRRRVPRRTDLERRRGQCDMRVVTALRLMDSPIESPISRRDIAKATGVSLRQLERLFQDQLGYGIHARYLLVRLARARHLLQETSLPIGKIAAATGFVSSGQFSRAFRRRFMSAPSELRRRRVPP